MHAASTTGAALTAFRTLIHQDVVMTRLEGCLTTVRTDGRRRRVFASARDANNVRSWMRPRFTGVVADATGRRVAAFFSQVTHDPRHCGGAVSARSDRIERGWRRADWLTSSEDRDRVARTAFRAPGRGRNVGLESCASTLRLCSGLAPASVNQSVRSPDPEVQRDRAPSAQSEAAPPLVSASQPPRDFPTWSAPLAPVKSRGGWAPSPPYVGPHANRCRASW